MRLFISINLPEDFNDYFRELQARLDKECGKIDEESKSGSFRDISSLSHAGRKSGFHLTLFFLGEVEASQVLKIQEALAQIKFDKFELRFWKDLGVFKDINGYAKSVFVAVDKAFSGYQEFLNLQKKITEVVGKFGFKDERKFSPHITLSRVKNCDRNFVDKITKIKIDQKSFEVSAFYLMESNLNEEGAEYREILKVAA